MAKSFICTTTEPIAATKAGIEQICCDGENLSKFGDVMVVSINHRLNILGYLDLSSYGEEYKNSGNVGNGDLVAALQWIHENIALFGKDPENVTLFGQSGGGAKVVSLMQTPVADGLFHKGIIMSGIATMIFDCCCAVKHNFDDELYKIFTPVAPNPFAPKSNTLVLH